MNVNSFLNNFLKQGWTSFGLDGNQPITELQIKRLEFRNHRKNA
jgi:hypothetical protein